MDSMLVEALEILVGNPVTVTLLVIGAICIVVAIVGELPSLREKITGVRAFFLGLFGVILMIVSVGLSWVLASSKSESIISITPTAIAHGILSTDTPVPTVDIPRQSSDIPTSMVNVPESTSTLIPIPTSTHVPPIATYTLIPTSTLLPAIPTLTRVPYAERLCPFAVTQSDIDSWSVGVVDEATVQSLIDVFDSGRPGNGGAFELNTTIPAGVIIATNFDATNPTSWLDYPVETIVRSGSWGLFRTVGEYQAPNAGACRIIVP